MGATARFALSVARYCHEGELVHATYTILTTSFLPRVPSMLHTLTHSAAGRRYRATGLTLVLFNHHSHAAVHMCGKIAKRRNHVIQIVSGLAVAAN